LKSLEIKINVFHFFNAVITSCI